ncbi:MAG: recombinase [Prevotella sp.]|nr:recombinase [Prevotella sp.]
MKINYVLSRKNVNGKSEIIFVIRHRHGNRVTDLRAKTGIFIDRGMFADGEVKEYSKRKLRTAEVVYHEEQVQKLSELKNYVHRCYNETYDKSSMQTCWLSDVVNEYYGVKNQDAENLDPFALFDEFCNRDNFSVSFRKNALSVKNNVQRWAMFIRMSDKNRRDFCMDIDTLTGDDVEDFMDYLRNEYNLIKEYPAVFAKMMETHPIKQVKQRGGNTLHYNAKTLKAFFGWLRKKGLTNNDPFKGVEVVREQYGTPYYLNIEERNKVASTDMPTQALQTQRDIFIFHCMIGCRVSDLMKLTEDNISNGVLVYVPHKTKDEGERSVQARIPLHPVAVELINKYRGMDKKGRLFPFITAQKYNDNIKVILALAGIDRKVQVRNSITGETELKPLHEVASSHIARRTFIGNAYRHVADPNIIGKMSGHAEGSKAFCRYRNIEDTILENVINKL